LTARADPIAISMLAPISTPVLTQIKPCAASLQPARNGNERTGETRNERRAHARQPPIWKSVVVPSRRPFGLGSIYMPFLCNSTPAHLDFLCRNGEKFASKLTRQSSSPVRRPAD
jgi:hypothetical protein